MLLEQADKLLEVTSLKANPNKEIHFSLYKSHSNSFEITASTHTSHFSQVWPLYPSTTTLQSFLVSQWPLSDFFLFLVGLPWIVANLSVLVAEPVWSAFPGSIFVRCLEERFSKTCNSSSDMAFAKSSFKSNPGSDSSDVGKTLTALLVPALISRGRNRSLPRETLSQWLEPCAEPRGLRFCCARAPRGLCFGPGAADSQLQTALPLWSPVCNHAPGWGLCWLPVSSGWVWWTCSSFGTESPQWLSAACVQSSACPEDSGGALEEAWLSPLLTAISATTESLDVPTMSLLPCDLLVLLLFVSALFMLKKKKKTLFCNAVMAWFPPNSPTTFPTPEKGRHALPHSPYLQANLEESPSVYLTADWTKR